MAFDPDKYLKKKSSFNPDAYLAKGQTPVSPQTSVVEDGGVSLRGLVRGAVENLPALGSTVGAGVGALGAGLPTLGLGAVGGAISGGAIGGFLGKATQNLAKTYLYDEPVTRSDVYLEPLKEGALGATAEMGGAVVNKGLGAIAKSGGALARKGVAEISGIGDDIAKIYTQDPAGVDTIVKAYGKEGAKNILPDFRKQLLSDSIGVRKNLAKELSAGLKSEAGARVVNIAPVKELLEAQLANVNKVTDPADYKQIKEMATRLNTLADKKGDIFLKDLHDFKKMAMNIGKGAYQKGGEVKQSAGYAAQVAKMAGAEARNVFNQAAPELAEINNKYFQLYEATDMLKGTALQKGKTTSRLATIAAGNAPEQAKAVQDLGRLIGKPDILKNLEKSYAATRLADPNLMSAWNTGRSTLGLLTGYQAGGYAASDNPEAKYAGALLGAGLGSPIVAKQLLRTPGLINRSGVRGAAGIIGRGAAQGLIRGE